ncbi:MAG: thiol-disulfide oxidoreductase DCC family protein [Pyrinomonadaceae bacterium]|nr:thiol-disulfide oxidoreductase DCC family protein [Blastocatellia bacterium]MCW5957849.1 thiol-disulfide oxidoreductase DCC family protein [Pyrinomonadaceae bacterium]
MGAIVLFDGVCNFCNASVNFIIERDRNGYFKFAPLQSEIGEELIAKHGIDTSKTDSIVVVEDDKAYTHSAGALQIARHLDGIWSWSYVFTVVPRPIRDVFYKLFAKYRYRLFGRQDACMMPTPEIRARFL